MDKTALRAATLGTKKDFRKSIVPINGVDFEVRQLSVKGRRDLLEKAYNSETSKLDTQEYLVWSVIKTTFVPGTDELVYSDADYESLVAEPTGSFVDKLGEASSKLLNVEEGKDTPASSETSS